MTHVSRTAAASGLESALLEEAPELALTGKSSYATVDKARTAAALLSASLWPACASTCAPKSRSRQPWGRMRLPGTNLQPVCCSRRVTHNS